MIQNITTQSTILKPWPFVHTGWSAKGDSANYKTKATQQKILRKIE